MEVNTLYVHAVFHALHGLVVNNSAWYVLMNTILDISDGKSWLWDNIHVVMNAVFLQTYVLS